MWCGSLRGRERLRSDSDCSMYDEEYRLVIIGAQNVGKTAICQIYVGGKEEHDITDRLVIQKTAKFHRSEFCTWDTVDGQTCCMRLSELRMPLSVTPQNVSDDHMIKTLAQKADGFLLIYSVTDKDSFRATTAYYDLIMQMRNYADTPLVFIAHKTDCTKKQAVTPSKGRDAAFNLGASFYETSVRSDPDGVKFVFHDVIRQVRSVRQHARMHDQPYTKVRGFIYRLSLKSRRRRSKSRSRQKQKSKEEAESDG